MAPQHPMVYQNSDGCLAVSWSLLGRGCLASYESKERWGYGGAWGHLVRSDDLTVQAVEDGKRAAFSIDEYLRS